MKSLKIINSIYRSSNSKIMTHINSIKDTILGTDNKKISKMKIDFNNIYNQDRILFPKIINNLKKL